MMPRSRHLFMPLLFALLLGLPAAGAPANSLRHNAAVPSPREVLGFAPGDDRKLADWSQIVAYFKRLDAASPRVSVHQPGLTTERRPFIVAIISSEENIENLPRIREAQRRLADPRLIANSEERERLIRTTPAVVAITCSIHSTEIVASQMSMELAYRLASDDAPATREMLSKTVLVLVPSVNPDGIDIVTNWYRKTLGTKYEGTSPPVLYHHYTGHDDNRDWFMLTQVETQIVSTLFWREWFPEIVYDVHQQGQFGSRMCVPPFFDPSNPNIDPTILRAVGALGSEMALNLQAAGFKGIVTNSTYDTWWHGGLRTAPYYHNAVGILTEAASVNIATPMQIKREQLRSPTRGLPDPLVAATNYPDPWQGGAWTMRDIMNMELVTTRTALEEAALHHDEYVRNFVNVAERAIEAGKRDAPYAYIVPAGQHDQPTADKMIDILIQQGVEVQRAKSDFTIDGKKYAAGSFVILLAQPYRANVKCLFEAQHYPDRRIYPGGPAEQPYDVAGWTLPMTMGVDYAEAGKRFEANLEKLNREFADLRSVSWMTGPAMQFFVSADANRTFDFVNALFSSPDKGRVSRLAQAVSAGGREYPAGTFVVSGESAGVQSKPPRSARMESKMRAFTNSISSLAVTRNVRLERVPDKDLQINLPAVARPVTRPRLALYRSWSPSMDEGWTRWVLEQFGFDYKNIYDADVRAGNLKDQFDVVILPDQSMQQIINGNRAGSYPEEYTGGITEAGVAALRSFVEAGGVLVCLDSATELALKRFDLPVKNVLEGLRRDQFYAPGSIFRAVVDNTNPLAYGMPTEADLYFVSGTRRGRGGDPDTTPAPEAPRPNAAARAESASRQSALPDGGSNLVSAFAFEITDAARARSVARYVDGNPLRSGWLLGPQFIAGKSALVDVQMGKGHVVLFGFRPQHRAQTWGTFKLLFNAILLGGTK
ncbi:MAG TPA: M14 metallopeptidase family protein [Blastocatellia bacterium]|nr:M14 metallopeptidase family protein [Blastocatellia bacterium]